MLEGSKKPSLASFEDEMVYLHEYKTTEINTLPWLNEPPTKMVIHETDTGACFRLIGTQMALHGIIV